MGKPGRDAGIDSISQGSPFHASLVRSETLGLAVAREDGQIEMKRPRGVVRARDHPEGPRWPKPLVHDTPRSYLH